MQEQFPAPRRGIRSIIALWATPGSQLSNQWPASMRVFFLGLQANPLKEIEYSTDNRGSEGNCSQNNTSLLIGIASYPEIFIIK